MQELNLPPYPFKVLKEGAKYKIFDPVRRKYLVLTPEEWVRQHMIQFLINERGFPGGLLRLEATVAHHQRKGRYDALFIDREGNPLVLVECKAPNVSIDSKTFDQINRYNSKLQASYLVVTNGIDHFFARVNFQESRLLFLNDMPKYEYLLDDK